MSIEQWYSDDSQVKLKRTVKIKLFHYHFVHQESHINSSEFEAETPQWEVFLTAWHMFILYTHTHNCGHTVYLRHKTCFIYALILSKILTGSLILLVFSCKLISRYYGISCNDSNGCYLFLSFMSLWSVWSTNIFINNLLSNKRTCNLYSPAVQGHFSQSYQIIHKIILYILVFLGLK
jgi:hypothetical protein